MIRRFMFGRSASHSSGRHEPAGDHLGVLAHPAGRFFQGQVDQDDAVAAERFALADHGGADIANPSAIHEDILARDALAQAHLPILELDHLAVLDHGDILGRDAHLAGQGSVLVQLAQLAVDRDEIFRADQVDEQLDLLLAGMPGNVDRSDGLIDDPGSALEQRLMVR